MDKRLSTCQCLNRERGSAPNSGGDSMLRSRRTNVQWRMSCSLAKGWLRKFAHYNQDGANRRQAREIRAGIDEAHRRDQPLQALSPKLSLPAPKTGLPEPTAAKSVDRRSD